MGGWWMSAEKPLNLYALFLNTLKGEQLYAYLSVIHLQFDYWIINFCVQQLHAKFDKLKKDHTEEKKKLEESRKKLEDEIVEFNRRKQQLQQQQMTSSHHTLTLGKSKKK